MPTKLKILNAKEIKEIKKLLKEQFGFEKNLDYIFLKNEKDKIYITSKDASKVNLSILSINTVGMYFAQFNKFSGEVRLSIEGARLIGEHCKKNIIDIDDEELKKWFRGEDLHMPKNCLKQAEGNFLILKNKDDFVGCGRYANSAILNFVGKERRVKSATNLVF